jgi:hypothetical protein
MLGQEAVELEARERRFPGGIEDPSPAADDDGEVRRGWRETELPGEP